MKDELLRSFDVVDLLQYEPDGTLRWKPGVVRYRSPLGGRVAGSYPVSSAGKRLYGRIKKGNGNIPIHVVIWEMFNGAIPDGFVVDHINRNHWDNRIENLRLATMQQNRNNSRVNSRSASRIKGVDKVGRRWRAMLKIYGKSIMHETFPTKGLAALAYAKASLRHHGKFSPFWSPLVSSNHPTKC